MFFTIVSETLISAILSDIPHDGEVVTAVRQVLPSELHDHIDRLSHRQLVAMRFASDAELAELVRDVVAGKLATGKEIKMRVKTWRADWLRA